VAAANAAAGLPQDVFTEKKSDRLMEDRLGIGSRGSKRWDRGERTGMALQRVLEPESMDDPAESQLYDAMDHRQVNERFVADLLALGMPGPDVIDLGTGTALIPIELCRQHPTCRVMAVDSAPSMLDLARRNVELSGAMTRIELRQVDAKGLASWRGARFNVVMSNSLIHHLAAPTPMLVDAVSKLTKAGSLLFVRDLLRPSSDAEVEQLVAMHTGNEPDHSRQLFRQSLHAALTLEEVEAMARCCGIDSACVKQTSDRHWTIAAVLGM
jgi:ubiquinone/menaquinone biosynthesis C-methylase UbiE